MNVSLQFATSSYVKYLAQAMHLYLIKIFFMHVDANDNCMYLTTEEENRLSTVCAIRARKSFSQTAFR